VEVKRHHGIDLTERRLSRACAAAVITAEQAVGPDQRREEVLRADRRRRSEGIGPEERGGSCHGSGPRDQAERMTALRQPERTLPAGCEHRLAVNLEARRRVAG